MPVYSLARAATEAGRSRSTLLRAIQTGRLSATRDATSGTWSIDASELRRAYPAGVNGHGDGHAGTAADDRGDSPALIAAKDALISEQRAVIDDLRRRLDQADTDRRQALDRLAVAQERIAALLTDQRSVKEETQAPPSRWGRFMAWRRGR